MIRVSIKVLIVFILGFTVFADKELWERVKRCPKNEIEWTDRSSKINCIKSNEKYHCLLDSTWKLVEVCIAPLTIKESEKGCPSTFIFETQPFWMFPFTPCPVQNKECPQEGHKGYSTEQLYKYPACFRNASYRTASDEDVQWTSTMTTVDAKRKQNDEFYRSDVNYIPYVLLLIIALIISLYVWNLFIVRDLRHKIERAASHGIHKTESLESVSSKAPLQGKENQGIEMKHLPKKCSEEKIGSISVTINGQAYFPETSCNSRIVSGIENHKTEVKQDSPNPMILNVQPASTCNQHMHDSGKSFPNMPRRQGESEA